jgi:hypothetical protein
VADLIAKIRDHKGTFSASELDYLFDIPEAREWFVYHPASTALPTRSSDLLTATARCLVNKGVSLAREKKMVLETTSHGKRTTTADKLPLGEARGHFVRNVLGVACTGGGHGAKYRYTIDESCEIIPAALDWLIKWCGVPEPGVSQLASVPSGDDSEIEVPTSTTPRPADSILDLETRNAVVGEALSDGSTSMEEVLGWIA